ncbi:leucine-rich repeat and immunoglobulin-like domain-containing nogo receptor-interacting protein 2 [Branchiostoma lanceolatum]|uniref:leucine-rich repeat and immunoglobulin-like domain-containing nogo receptor-interacting protein 2 n=1 Tax=Branchiostoma lanceolatum TaxID=7740 RepID=UPI0034519B53
MNIQPGTFSNLPQLQKLHLSSNQITNIQPGTFSNLPLLQELRLDSNQITYIQPGAFSNLLLLQELRLSSNQITTIQPDALSNLPQLQTLYLNNNKITTIQHGIFSNLLKLQELRLDSNQITTIQSGAFANLPKLQELHLNSNKMTTIQPGIFSNLPLLRELLLFSNQINTIQVGAFSNLLQLQKLILSNNQITTIQPGAFSHLPKLQRLYLNSNQITSIQLQTLYLSSNRLVSLPSTAYSMLSSIPSIMISNNPWQCNCRMLPFRQKMSGSHSFENHILCAKPANLHMQKLKDINPEDLNCEEPTIVRFQRVKNNTLVLGKTLHLVCEASGVPKPDITVTLPSGQNASLESSERVTMGVNGTISIPNVTAADAGQYICTAGNPAGSASATLYVDVHLNLPTTTTNASPLSVATTEHLESDPTFSPPVLVHSPPSEEPESHPNLPVSVPIATIAGAAAGTVLIGSIVLTICWKRWTRNRSVGQDPGVESNNTCTDTRATVTTDGAPDTTVTVTVTTGGHDQMQHHDADA